MSARAVSFALAALIFQGSLAFGQAKTPPLPPLDPAEAKQLEGALDRAAKLPNDEFCHKSEAQFFRDRRLCAFSSAAERRCPAFRAACRDPVQRPRGRRPFWSFIGDDALVILGYSALIALVLAVLYAIRVFLKDLLGGVVRSPEPELAAEPAALPQAPEESSSERNVQRRLQRARELAAQGNYAVALGELHAAVVLALDARGVIEARKGRTNGDYARELAAQPELSAAFREVTRNVESVQFGARAADRSLFERSLERSASLMGPGLTVLGLGLSLLLTGCQRAPAGQGSAAAACGTSADGYSFLCSALEATRGARRRHRSLSELDYSVSVLVVVADELGEEDQDAIANWVLEEGTLVTTRRIPAIDQELGLGRRGPPCAGEIALEGASPTDAKLTVDLHPTLQPSAKLAVYAGCGAGAVAVRGFYGDGEVVALSAPSLLSNASFAAGSNAELLLRMIPRTQGAVEIVGDWTGSSASSPFASLRAAGLLPWLAHLALLGFAFARFRGTPFARRHVLREDPRRRFVEHVQALGERWADARASRVALSAYATWGLDALRERTSGAGQANLSDLADALSRRGGGSPDAVLRTLAKCRLAQEGDDGASEAEHLETLRALSKLISEVGGSRWT